MEQMQDVKSSSTKCTRFFLYVLAAYVMVILQNAMVATDSSIHLFFKSLMYFWISNISNNTPLHSSNHDAALNYVKANIKFDQIKVLASCYKGRRVK